MADDMLSSLKGLLGDNADEKIGAVLGALTSKGDNNTHNIDDDIVINTKPVVQNNPKGKDLFSPEGIEYMAKIKGIIDEMGSVNDPRSNLLMSLRPYMRASRRASIDNAVKILNLSRATGFFKI